MSCYNGRRWTSWKLCPELLKLVQSSLELTIGGIWKSWSLEWRVESLWVVCPLFSFRWYGGRIGSNQMHGYIKSQISGTGWNRLGWWSWVEKEKTETWGGAGVWGLGTGLTEQELWEWEPVCGRERGSRNMGHGSHVQSMLGGELEKGKGETPTRMEDWGLEGEEDADKEPGTD